MKEAASWYLTSWHLVSDLRSPSRCLPRVTLLRTSLWSPSPSKINYYYFYLVVCIYERASCKSGCPGRPKVLDFLELQLQVLVSHLKWVQEQHALVTAESPLQFSNPNSFSSLSPYEQKAQIIARTTENCTNCSRGQGFLRGHDPTVSSELRTQHTGTASNYVGI